MDPNDSSCILNWPVHEVQSWLKKKKYLPEIARSFEFHRVDGRALLLLNEDDLKTILADQPLGVVKKLFHDIQQLRFDNKQVLYDKGYDPYSLLHVPNKSLFRNGFSGEQTEYFKRHSTRSEAEALPLTHHYSTDSTPYAQNAIRENSYQSSRSSDDGQSPCLKPEFTKAVLALAYLFVVTWITSFVMVIVHDRVPDMKRYPPLPDIFLDNVPYIPWAFHMCEWTATVLVIIWVIVLTFHKYRFILLRRFFALCGTVFLLRCITMLITSLSVPGSHLKCSPRISTFNSDYFFGDILAKIKQAYIIWTNAGLSIRGVRTCGDYMFSGHSVVLTMLNFFITEYTPRDLHLLHIFTWVLNMFGIFFILSGHEHYSIDVFIAFYITSRLFLYYHTLANNQALMQRDSTRTRIWFPLFSFFEASIDGIVPNEYESVSEICENVYVCGKLVCVKLLKTRMMIAAKVHLLNAKTSETRNNTNSGNMKSRHSCKRSKKQKVP